MKTFNALISTENSSLAAYTGRRYTKGITSISFEELGQVSKNTQKALSVLWRVLTGEEPPAEAQAIAVSAQSGAFKKFYGPELAQKEGHIGVAFGPEFLPIPTKKGAFDGPLPEDVSVKLSFQTVEMNGFDELTFKIVIMLDKSDTLLVFNLPLRLRDYQAELPDIDTLTAYLERKLQNLQELLDEPYSGTSFDGPTLKLGNLLIDEVYTITGYRPVNTSNGPSFMVVITGEKEGEEPIQEYLVVANHEDKGATEPLLQAEVWANGTIKGFLNSNPQITPETPAQMTIRSKKKTKSGYITVDVGIIFDSPDVVQATEEDLSFDF